MPEADAPEITPYQLARALEAGDDIQVLDVRAPAPLSRPRWLVYPRLTQDAFLKHHLVKLD